MRTELRHPGIGGRVTDPTIPLALSLIVSLGWALSYRAKWRRAERQLANAKEVSEFRAKLIDNQERTVQELLEKLDHTERLWKDAKRMYLDSLDEIAALRDGAAE